MVKKIIKNKRISVFLIWSQLKQFHLQSKKMKCQQICYLLLEAAQGQDHSVQGGNIDSFDLDPIAKNTGSLVSRLQQILVTLEEEKNLFISQQTQQHQSHLDKIHAEKDQIIQDLLKSIYNLKKQNQQLRFQYRKRFKVIKNIQDKYQNLIQAKNKKISELDSVVKYLEGKIKHLQKKLSKYDSQIRKEISINKYQMLSKSPENYISPNKFSVIVSRENNCTDPMKRFIAKDSFEELTMPMTSSFVSSSKVTSSSKTITRNRSKGKYKQICVSNFTEPRESDVYSSTVGLSERKFDENGVDSQTNFEDNSRITPICLDKHHSILTSNYLTFQDFNDLDKNDHISGESSTRSSQRVTHNALRDRWNFVRKYY